MLDALGALCLSGDADIIVKKALVIFMLLSVLLVAGGRWYQRSRPSEQDVVQKVFGSKQVFDAFLASQTATAQRLHWHRQQGESSVKLRSYDHDSPVIVPPARIQEIQALLRHSASYVWRSSKSCIVDYGVLLTFSSGQRTVRVALCFKCNWLGIFDGGDDNAESVSTEDDFDPVRKQPVTIIKSIFPTDAEIQALK